MLKENHEEWIRKLDVSEEKSKWVWKEKRRGMCCMCHTLALNNIHYVTNQQIHTIKMYFILSYFAIH
jgi:hypothetical protein